MTCSDPEFIERELLRKVDHFGFYLILCTAAVAGR